VPALLLAFPSASALWQAETTSDGSSITKRHETGSVVVNGNLYVLGGRRLLPVEVYKPSTDGWESLGLGPIEMHHFQPVAVGSKIYAIVSTDKFQQTVFVVAQVRLFIKTKFMLLAEIHSVTTVVR